MCCPAKNITQRGAGLGEAEALIAQGDQLFADGDAVGAVETYRSALSKLPNQKQPVAKGQGKAKAQGKVKGSQLKSDNVAETHDNHAVFLPLGTR